MAITLFLNKRSGSVRNKTRDELATLLGPECRVQDSSAANLRTEVSAAVKRGDQIVVAGGDGTVASVAAYLNETDVSLGILPLGTFNHFARDLKIPNALDEAAQVILEGHSAKVDTAYVNSRMFLNTSALGLYPRLVLARERLEKRGLPRWAALCSAAVNILTHYETMHVEFEIDGKKTVRRTPLVFVGNNTYTLTGFTAGAREDLCSNVLTVAIARHQTLGSFVIGILKVLAGVTKDTDTLEILHLRSLSVATKSRKTVVSTDGEVSVMDSPLRYSVRPQSLTVLTPAQ